MLNIVLASHLLPFPSQTIQTIRFPLGMSSGCKRSEIPIRKRISTQLESRSAQGQTPRRKTPHTHTNNNSTEDHFHITAQTFTHSDPSKPVLTQFLCSLARASASRRALNPISLALYKQYESEIQRFKSFQPKFIRDFKGLLRRSTSKAWF